MVAQNMPAAEVDITEDLVRGLLSEQHPDLADLPLTLVANGWDNAIYRLGHDLAVRAPRREIAASLVEHEQQWLPGLAARLPIAIPAPVRTGAPSEDYPWKWSICPWLDGEVAARSTLTSPTTEARRLGEFLAALHQPAPAEIPANPYFRGGPIRALGGRVEENVSHLEDAAVAAAVIDRWQTVTAVDEWGTAPVWVHGDLHTANLLVDDGRINAVIDFGDIAAGDPAVDFAIAWMLFDDAERAVFRAATGITDDATWSRAEGWALHFAVLYLIHSADNRLIHDMGVELIETLLGRV